MGDGRYYIKCCDKKFNLLKQIPKDEEWCLLGCYAVWLLLVLTRATRRNNPEDTILHSHRRENLKS
jgi:hypothetical protein